MMHCSNLPKNVAKTYLEMSQNIARFKFFGRFVKGAAMLRSNLSDSSDTNIACTVAVYKPFFPLKTAP